MESTTEHDCFSHLFQSAVSRMIPSVVKLSTGEQSRHGSTQENMNGNYRAYLAAARGEVFRVLNDHAAAYSRSRQNQLAPVYRLRIPDDIFSMIFELAVAEGPWEVPLTIATVCRSWRRIIFAAPRLWTRINGYSAHDFLPRTKSAPLEIKYEGYTKDNQRYPLQEFLSLLIPHSNRWRVLHFTIRCDDVPSFRDLVNITATRLESLTIGTPYWHTAFEETIGLDLFSGNTPRLRDLNLSSVRISALNSPFVSGLVWLRLHNIVFDGSDERLAYQLLHAIGMCPSLKTLYLSMLRATARATAGSRPPTKTPHLPLPYLRTFALHQIPYPCVTRLLLESIQFPPIAQVKLVLPDSGPHEMPSYFPHIPNACLLGSLRIEGIGGPWEVKGWDRDGSELLLVSGCSADDLRHYPMPNVTRLSIGINIRNVDLAEHLATIIQQLPLLTHIWVTCMGYEVSMHGVPDALACPSLRRVYLVDCPIRSTVLQYVQSRLVDSRRPDGSFIDLTLLNCEILDDPTTTPQSSRSSTTAHRALRCSPYKINSPPDYHFPVDKMGGISDSEK
ncbi:hypothetical protein BOTBODRAFT_64087 [Botryobasidium botryosum FD-172 SS1]|uniref:Uncharacterized protein n=1 Tax=Botryobasidium botryosum (strain FD-172 SS1) TaxID=930990 RepID=A0A067MQ03_BOTB1|nr:hypothetical protein BOTBODRAFT_64087 [Botryobasidium botryosum FD-172 SS1]